MCSVRLHTKGTLPWEKSIGKGYVMPMFNAVCACEHKKVSQIEWWKHSYGRNAPFCAGMHFGLNEGCYITCTYLKWLLWVSYRLYCGLTSAQKICRRTMEHYILRNATTALLGSLIFSFWHCYSNERPSVWPTGRALFKYFWPLLPFLQRIF